MFEEKDIIGDAVRRAVKLFQQRKRGDVVAWAEINETAGFDKTSPHWSQFDKRFRRDFRRDTGIVLWPVNGVGLQLLTVKDQLHMRSIARARRATRQMTRDLIELRAIPDRELSDHDRQVKYRKIDQSRQARRGVLYSARLGHVLARPNKTGMPRPVAAAK
jgi:hypothetical protein